MLNELDRRLLDAAPGYRRAYEHGQRSVLEAVLRKLVVEHLGRSLKPSEEEELERRTNEIEPDNVVEVVRRPSEALLKWVLGSSGEGKGLATASAIKAKPFGLAAKMEELDELDRRLLNAVPGYRDAYNRGKAEGREEGRREIVQEIVKEILRNLVVKHLDRSLMPSEEEELERRLLELEPAKMVEVVRMPSEALLKWVLGSGAEGKS